MRFEVGRLRTGEKVAAGGAVLLFVSLFFFKWYGVDLDLGGGFSASVNGWDAHSILRWLMLLTIVAALALAFLTATQQTVALPVTAAVIVTALAALLTLLLAYRVLIDEPGPNDVIGVRFGAYLGLISAAIVLAGGYLSMRDESQPGTVAPGAPPA